jgi:hypothetical protein
VPVLCARAIRAALTPFAAQGSVTLPGTRFNSITRRVGLQGPVMIDLRAVTVTAIV